MTGRPLIRGMQVAGFGWQRLHVMPNNVTAMVVSPHLSGMTKC